MTRTDFDAFTRRLATPATRRTATRLGVGALVAGVLVQVDPEAARATCVHRCIVRCVGRCPIRWSGPRCHRVCRGRTQTCQTHCYG